MQAVLGGVAACLAVEVLNIGEHKSPRGRLTGNWAFAPEHCMVPHGHAGPVRCGHGQATLNGALCGDAGGQSLLWPSLASCATAVLGECGRAAIVLLEILGTCCHCVCCIPDPMHRCCSRRPVAQRDAAAGHPGAAHLRLLPAMWPLAVHPCLCKPTPGESGVLSSTCWAASSCADKAEPAAGREAQGARQGGQDPPKPAGAAQHLAPAAATPQATGPSTAFVAAIDQCGVCNRALNRQLRMVQQQLAAVDAERAALRQGLAAADAERAALRQGLGEADAERAALRQGLGEAAAERAALRQGLGEAERKCCALREELARAHASKAVAALHLRQLHWYSDVRAWTRLLVVAQARAPLPPRAPPAPAQL